MRKGGFIVLEEIDGVGKTTTGIKLAEELGYQYIDSVPKPFLDNIDQFQKELTQDSFFIYMLSMIKQISDTVHTIRNKGGGVVLSRYYQTPYVYHAAHSKNAGTPHHLHIQIDHLKLEPPSHTFFLYADEYDRKQRLKYRTSTTEDDKLTFNDSFRKILMREYEQFEMIKINTTKDSAETVAKKIKDIYLTPKTENKFYI